MKLPTGKEIPIVASLVTEGKDTTKRNVGTMDERLRASEAGRRFALILFEAFGVMALVLAAIGTYSLLSGSVTERTREIGVRKALGATPSHIVTSIVQESVFITTVAGYLGLVAGIGGLALIDRLLPPTDMFAHPEVDMRVALGATVLLIIAGALAGLFPARAAARVNPIEALRDG